MIFFLKNKNGFSLPELMIAVGIAGIVAYAATKVMTDSYKNQNYIQAMVDIDKEMAILQSSLSNQNNCDYIFAAYNSAQTFSPAVSLTAISLPAAGRTDTVDILKVKDYGKYSVTGIQIAATTNARVKDVIVTFVWKDRPLLSTATIEKRVSVFSGIDFGQNGVLDATDKWKCGGVVRETKVASQKEMCDALNIPVSSGASTPLAVWNPIPAPGNCSIIEFKCPAGQIARSLSSLGHVRCTPTQTAIDLTTVIYTTPVACPATSTNIKIEFSGGLYRLVCSP